MNLVYGIDETRNQLEYILIATESEFFAYTIEQEKIMFFQASNLELTTLSVVDVDNDKQAEILTQTTENQYSLYTFDYTNSTLFPLWQKQYTVDQIVFYHPIREEFYSK